VAAPTDGTGGYVARMPYGFRNDAYKCLRGQGGRLTNILLISSSDSINQNLPSGVTTAIDAHCLTDGQP
jgi:hypothetical protein